MDVALPFIGLCHKEITDVSADVVLIADCVSPKYLLQSAVYLVQHSNQSLSPRNL